MGLLLSFRIETSQSVFEQVLFDDYILLTTGPNLTKRAQIACLMTLTHLTSLNESHVSDGGG